LLYIVLSGLRTAPGGAAVDTILYGLLATTGTPLSSPARSATSFEMREASSGALYNWTPVTPQHELSYPFDGAQVADLANFVLRRGASGARRGVDQLVYGATYLLDIETEGVPIHGSVTLPALFDLTFSETAGSRVVAWPHVRGAVEYSVSVWHGAEFFLSAGGVTTDTSFAIPSRFVTGDTVFVTARDANYRAARSDQIAEAKSGRVGIDRGYGVFAAYTSTRSVLP
jgi:hypothetical protein